MLAARQDSLATAATALARQLGDSTGLLAGQVVAARRLLATGQQQAARARLLPVLAAARRRAPWLETITLLTLGRNCWGTAAHSQAVRYWRQAWAAAQRQPDAYWRVRTALLLANAGPGYAQGLHWYFIGLRLAEQHDCQVCQADALNGIGYNYSLLGEWALVARYTRQALRQHQALRNVSGEYGSLIGLANLQTQQAQHQAALATYQRARQFLRSSQDSLPVVTGLASTHAALGRYALAKAQARQGLALARCLGTRALQEDVNLTLARASLGQGRADSAVYYGQLAWLHRPRTAGQTTAGTCQVLAQAYAARRDFALAYAFQQRAQAYADTLTNDKIRSQAAQARYSYELEKQQRQIAQLERDQALGRLRHQQQLAAGGLAGLLLAALGGGVLWAARRRQRRRLAALRAQLATDLHDEVGTLLTRVSVQAELLQSLPPAQQPLAVAGLLRNSRAAASTMRDVVWGIDARRLGGLAARPHARIRNAAANPTLGDIDGDGDLDIAVPKRDNDRVAILLNDGQGSFAPPATNAEIFVPSPQNAVLADVDDDGDLDLLVLNAKLNVYRNDGTGRFDFHMAGNISTPLLGLAAGDVDGDGDLDALG